MKRLAALSLIAALAAGAATDRKQSIERGLRFIYQTALDPANFAEYGSDYLWCLYSIGATSRDPELAREATKMARERAAVWRRQHPVVPANADADEIGDLAFGSYAADQLGLPDRALKDQIRKAAPLHKVEDYLAFDPSREAPPRDVPDTCRKCQRENPRGATVCRHCGAKLEMRTRYDVWYSALITAYTGDRYGITLGAPYSEVIRWAPAMRPYRGREGGANPDYWDSIYAVTHVIYTLNDYSRLTLSPAQLPDEFAFLRDNLHEAVIAKEPETIGEFLDSLKAFGLKDDDPVIRDGVDYLLANQNADGSWGNLEEKDIYSRYHPTWTAVDGLRDYKWRGRAKLPKVLLGKDHPLALNAASH